MSFIHLLTPTNLLSEKEKFFADQTYNPQFTYTQAIDENQLNQYGQVHDAYKHLAYSLLARVLAEHKLETLETAEGASLSQVQVENTTQTFLQMHELENRYSLQWSASFVSRTAITNSVIKLRLPVSFRQRDLLSMLYHEIGTHALRRINYEEQPWFKKKKKFGFGEYLYTEEGLAALHGLLPLAQPLAFKQARLYVAVDLAQKHSFAEVFSRLADFQPNPEKRWSLVVRVKRGIMDTAQPGGYTKDLVYFQGMHETAQWLAANNFNIASLYFGKIAANDAPAAVAHNPSFKPLLPSFFVTNQERYAEQIHAIGILNGFLSN
jgi:hypothetical protein